jgi:hypothetical protein
MALPHYVADGGNENIRQWRREGIDLREVYSHIWPDGAPAHLVDIAIFLRFRREPMAIPSSILPM